MDCYIVVSSNGEKNGEKMEKKMSLCMDCYIVVSSNGESTERQERFMGHSSSLSNQGEAYKQDYTQD